jgi:membrane associated rhomboid family serine protease
MLEDRDYMRQPEFGSRWPRRRFGIQWSLTVCFLIAYAAVFFIEQALPNSGSFFYTYFALSNEGLAHGYVWQLLTYQFMHSGFLHLFFNGWAIYTFGLALESDLGAKRYAALMLASGVIGGVVQSAAGVLSPSHFGGNVVGASACAFGLVAAFAALYPTRELTMLVFFVIPVTLAARMLLIISAVLAVLAIGLTLITSTGNVAHAAHLGGMAMGWLFVRMDWRRFMPREKEAVRVSERQPKLQVLETPPAKSLEGEVDAILDKISAHGMKSLTAREREILEAARKKL